VGNIYCSLQSIYYSGSFAKVGGLIVIKEDAEREMPVSSRSLNGAALGAGSYWRLLAPISRTQPNKAPTLIAYFGGCPVNSRLAFAVNE